MRAGPRGSRQRESLVELFGRTPESRARQREQLRALLCEAIVPMTARELAVQLTGEQRPLAPVVDYVRADLHFLLNHDLAVSTGNLPARYRATPRARRAR